MSPYLKRAQELRAITERHYNCAQSVAVAFAPALKMDEETLFRMAANFGGGMKMGATCGTVTGAFMVLGLAGIDDPAQLRRICKSLREKHDGALDCRDLLAKSAAAGIPKKPHCDALVYEMVELTEQILTEHGVI